MLPQTPPVPSRSETRRLAAVLFTDIVGSTQVAAELGDARWRALLDRHLAIVRRELKRFGGRLNDTAGDGVFATFERPTEAIRCAVALTEAVRELGIEIRAGVHFGETERIGDKLGGIAVHTGARVMSAGGPGEVLVTAATRDLVQGSGFTFDDRGLHELKGIEGEQRLFAVVAVDDRPLDGPLAPELAAERLAAVRETERSRRRPLLIGAIVASVVGVSLVLASLAASEPDAGQGSSPSPTGETGGTFLVRIDPADLRVDAVGRIDMPGWVFFYLPPTAGGGLVHVDHRLQAGAGSLWLLFLRGLVEVDPTTAEVVGELPWRFSTMLQASTQQVIRQRDWRVWALVGFRLNEIDPAGVTLAQDRILHPSAGLSATDLAAGGRGLWVGSGATLIEVDPETLRGRARDVPFSIDQLEYGAGSLYALDIVAGELLRIDPGTADALARTKVSVGAPVLRADDEGVWLLDASAGTVASFDPEDLRPLDTFAAGDEPVDMALGADAAWVADEAGAVWRIDRLTGEVTRIAVGGPVVAVVADEVSGSVWAVTDTGTGA